MAIETERENSGMNRILPRQAGSGKHAAETPLTRARANS
jgi:hypothetical protein